MVDSKNDCSIALAKTALSVAFTLAKSSGKADGIVLRAMMIANGEFEYLIEHKTDFVGVPGEYQENQVKRQRLAHMVMPGC